MYLYSRHYFLCMFSDSDLSIYMYLLHFRFTVVPLCYLSLSVPVCLNHITWPCTRVITWARQLVLTYVLAGLLSENPEFSCPNLKFWTVVTVPDQSAQQKRGLAVACPDPLSSSFPLFGSWDFSSCYSWVLSRLLYCTSYFYASWWYYILKLLYHALW